MSLFDFFKPRPESLIDHVHQILRRGSELNEGEQECVNQVWKLSPLKPGDQISPEFRNSCVACGLYLYKKVEWQKAADTMNTCEAIANQHIQNIICAVAKAYFIFPIPVFLYHIGEYLALLGHPSDDEFMGQFLDAQQKFQPDQLMLDFLNSMNCDVNAAISKAERIVRRDSA